MDIYTLLLKNWEGNWKNFHRKILFLLCGRLRDSNTEQQLSWDYSDLRHSDERGASVGSLCVGGLRPISKEPNSLFDIENKSPAAMLQLHWQAFISCRILLVGISSSAMDPLCLNYERLEICSYGCCSSVSWCLVLLWGWASNLVRWIVSCYYKILGF